MSATVTLSVQEALDLAIAILVANDTDEANARSVADALVSAEMDGQSGHGLLRLPSYAAQAASGKVDGNATPVLEECGTAAVRIDASNGFAFPALALARAALTERSATTGIAAATIFRSHHFGQAGYHVEKLAESGFVGLIFGNSPQAIAPWGGSKGVFGTNPIAFASPRRDEPPLLIDLSLSKEARGKVMAAAKDGRPIPEGIALDRDGNATTDPEAALAGTMLPMGDAKGAALVLMVEVLSAALAGANFGFEASSFFTPDGPPPGVGQTLIAINPGPLSGGSFGARLENLIEAILDQENTRLPGTRRLKARDQAREKGLSLTKTFHDELVRLAG